MFDMATAIPNFEEASNVATEFIYSIDNLPNEIAHILSEIKHRDVRTVELQNEIDQEAAHYVRHSRRASSASVSMPMSAMSNVSGITPSTPVPATPSTSSSRGESVTPNGTAVLLPQKISATYAEIHELATEKCALAQKLVNIITRTRSKLDVDIARVRLLQGEPPELVAAQASASIHMRPAGMMSIPGLNGGAPVGASSADSFGAPGQNPALAISESLRNALAQPAADRAVTSSATGASSPAPSTGHVTKKRRTTTATSIKISPAASPTKHRSASPASVTPAAHTQTKSRLSRQVHPPPPPPEDDDLDLDGEGEEEDAEVEDDNEDETLYCFCQKQSYGDMIACDNEGACPYEWFHLACVGLKQPPAEKWFCSVCAKTKGLTTGTTSSRKGRKK